MKTLADIAGGFLNEEKPGSGKLVHFIAAKKQWHKINETNSCDINCIDCGGRACYTPLVIARHSPETTASIERVWICANYLCHTTSDTSYHSGEQITKAINRTYSQNPRKPLR